jgi:hypothetical protein
VNKVLRALHEKYGSNFRPNLLIHPLTDIQDIVGAQDYKTIVSELQSHDYIEVNSNGQVFLTEKGYLCAIEIT